MKTFTDSQNHEWKISITLGSAMEIQDRLDVDILQPEKGSPPLITRLGTEERLLGEVILVLIEDQFEANGVTAENVKKVFDGDTLLKAQNALYEEMVNFFQSRARTDRSRATARQLEIIQKATKRVTEKIDALDLDKLVDEALDETSGEMSGKSQAPSESTPAP